MNAALNHFVTLCPVLDSVLLGRLMLFYCIFTVQKLYSLMHQPQRQGKDILFVFLSERVQFFLTVTSSHPDAGWPVLTFCSLFHLALFVFVLHTVVKQMAVWEMLGEIPA